MPNAGLDATRAAVARHLESETGLPFRAGHVVMTVGAGGGLNVLLKSLLDPGDEVVVLAPYFVEYVHYVESHAGKTVVVDTDERFRPDAEAIAAALTPRTRAVIVNSPNNPTGAVYAMDDYRAVAAVLEEAFVRWGRPIRLISDEPYRAIVYDGIEVPWHLHAGPDTVLVTSFSKDLGLAGERIGYVAIHPEARDADLLHRAMTFSMRALGFVNAPALQQRLVEGLLDVHVDLEGYARHRARLLAALAESGYEVVPPGGAFYLFPRTPEGMDDVRFCRTCMDDLLLVVPGSGFGRPGHFRISYAVDEPTIDRAVAALARVRARVRA
jgi:aspartate aminotransferase